VPEPAETKEGLNHLHSAAATFKVTADTYTQAVRPVKRDAQAQVAKLILGGCSRTKASNNSFGPRFCRHPIHGWMLMASVLVLDAKVERAIGIEFDRVAVADGEAHRLRSRVPRSCSK